MLLFSCPFLGKLFKQRCQSYQQFWIRKKCKARQGRPALTLVSTIWRTPILRECSSDESLLWPAFPCWLDWGSKNPCFKPAPHTFLALCATHSGKFIPFTFGQFCQFLNKKLNFPLCGALSIYSPTNCQILLFLVKHRGSNLKRALKKVSKMKYDDDEIASKSCWKSCVKIDTKDLIKVLNAVLAPQHQDIALCGLQQCRYR